MNRQLGREQAMRERGQHRAEKTFTRAVETGRAAETPAGDVLAKKALAAPG